MDKSALERFLESSAINLVLFGWIRGAQWGTANAVSTTKLTQQFIKDFQLDLDEDAARMIFNRMADKYREVEKMK